MGHVNEISITIEDECIVDDAWSERCIAAQDGIVAAYDIVGVAIPRPPSS